MASPSHPTSSSSRLSIQSIISPDESSITDRSSGSSQAYATTPTAAPSPSRHDPVFGLGFKLATRPSLETSSSLPRGVDSRQYPYQLPLQHHYQHQLPLISSVALLPPLLSHPLPSPNGKPPQDQQDYPRLLQQAPIHQVTSHRVIPEEPPIVLASLNPSVIGRVARETREHEQIATSPSMYGYPSPAAGVPDSPSSSNMTKTPFVAKRAPMRSSIACFRCRRSKIKCVNNGEGKAACETCLKSRRDCEYPVPNGQSSMADPGLQFVHTTAARAPASLKREDIGQPDRNMDRKRVKKSDDSHRLDDQKVGAYNANELLSEKFLKEMMWTEIFDLFQVHFSTELPFIHMPTIKAKMGDKTITRRPDSTNLVLLGILTLTARFHSDLSKYTASFIANSSKTRAAATTRSAPCMASEYFADTLTRALGPFRTSVSIVSVEHVQALLMLGLYEWTQSKRPNAGISAWMTVGFAIRMAQGLGLSYEKEPDQPQHQFQATTPSVVPVTTVEDDTEFVDSDAESDIATITSGSYSSSLSQAESGREYPRAVPDGTARASHGRGAKGPVSITALDEKIASEVYRRTMFSCFVLDRMLACGKKRTTMIQPGDLRILLPCAEVDFGSSKKVPSVFLRPRPSLSAGGAAVTRTDSLLGSFIRLIDIWGDICKYSFPGGKHNVGGRHKEKRPPWEDTKFRRLRGVLDHYYATLSEEYTFNHNNYHRHEHYQRSSTYVSLHMLGAVCQIMLHREYIPFIPIRCKRPVGPLDGQTFPEGSAPEGFWEDSAERVFKAAREIVDLVEKCQTRKKLPMSALVVFSVWTAAFVGIYACHFPQMDVKHHMASGDEPTRSQSRASRAGKGREYRAVTRGPTAVAYTALTGMANYLHTASTYVKNFHFMDQFYEEFKADYHACMERDGAAAATAAAGEVGVRQGGKGGGLDEWKVLGSKVTNNGTILSADDPLPDEPDTERSTSRSAKDSSSVERRSSSDEDHGRKPPWAVPARSSSSRSETVNFADPSSRGKPPAGGSAENVTVITDHEDGASVVAPVVPVNGMQGVVYGNGGDMQMMNGGIVDAGLGGDDLLPVQDQPWDLYTPVAPIDSQVLGDTVYFPGPDPANPAANAIFYNGYSNRFYNLDQILEYLALHEGSRWEGLLRAASIQHLIQVDDDGTIVGIMTTPPY